MMGLDFSWEDRDGLLVVSDGSGGVHPATFYEKALINRVEELWEAAEQSRLLLNTLPTAIERAEDEMQALRVLEQRLYAAESVLAFVLAPQTADEAESERLKQFPNHSEADHGE